MLSAVLNILSLTLVLSGLVMLGVLLFGWFYAHSPAAGVRRWAAGVLYGVLLVTAIGAQAYYSFARDYIVRQPNPQLLWVSLIGSRLIGVGLAVYYYNYLLQRKQTTAAQARVLALEQMGREAEVERLRQETRIIFVDMHAETTSEKIAMGRFLDGRVSAVVGTHTHTQTADDQIFPGGTAFLCDAGMCGPVVSCLGREVEPIIQRFLTGRPIQYPVASGPVKLHGAIIEIDEASGRALKIERVAEMFHPQHG